MPPPLLATTIEVRPIFSISPHPKNARKGDIKAIAASIRANGFFGTIVVQRSTNYILVGKHRWLAAQACGLTEVPCTIVDVTDQQALRILVADNGASDLGGYDDAGLAALLSSLAGTEEGLLGSTYTDDYLVSLLKEVTAKQATGERTKGDAVSPIAPVELPGSAVGGPEREDLAYPSDNDWGVPNLLPELQCLAPVLPFQKWGSIARNQRITGTWHFYCEDYRFSALWDRPGAIPATTPKAVVEVNFSTRETWPKAVNLWAVYRKRWLARYWQECGIPVIVDVNMSPHCADIMLLGVPKGWQAYATRAQSADDYRAWVEFAYDLAATHAGGKPKLFLVYGGGREYKEWVYSHPGWTWLPEWTAEAIARSRAKKQAQAQEEDVA